jgi:hypothetical protein
MKKHWIALAVTVTLAVGASASYAATTYSDVSNNWAQNEINEVVNRNIMTGFNDGMFHPDAWVTRSEFVTMSSKTLGLPQQQLETVPSFRNISQNYSGFQSVDNQAWISSYPSGVFRPANPIRRVEVLSGLAGALNKPLVSEEEANEILSKYKDAAQVPANERRQVATAIKYDLFEIDPKSGDNIIDPLRPATRAEVAAMLNELYENRDIAIVQNGQLISQTEQQQQSVSSRQTISSSQTTDMSTTGSTTTGTSMVRTTDAESSSTYSSTGTTGQTTTGTYGQQGTTGTGTTAQTQATDMHTAAQANPGIDFMQGKGTPYRNSADTIPAFRSVNTTTTPSGMAATEPISLAPNTTFTGTVAKAIYSEYNRVGDPVMVIVDHAIYDSNGRIAAPAGSRVMGIITDLTSRNQSGDTAQVGITFNGLITPTGQQIPISAKVNNADGILKAGELQGVVFHPNRSVDALKREISASQGSLYGTKVGKAYVLEEPLASQVSDRPLDPMDLSKADIVIGVGDRLQLRIDSIGQGAQTNTDNQ